MSGHTQSDRDQVTYRMYDDREVSREAIDRAVRTLEAQRRRQERLLQLRSWALVGLIVLIVAIACAALVWRLTLAL